VRFVRARLFAIAFMSFSCTWAAAADKPCTKPDQQRAMKAIDAVVTWQQLYKSWQDFGHCDTGGDVSDQFADALLRLVVDWKNVPTFSAAVAKDAGYKAFVLQHLKAATKDDRDAVYSRAKTLCPTGEDAFCAELGEVVKPQ